MRRPTDIFKRSSASTTVRSGSTQWLSAVIATATNILLRSPLQQGSCCKNVFATLVLLRKKILQHILCCRKICNEDDVAEKLSSFASPFELRHCNSNREVASDGRGRHGGGRRKTFRARAHCGGRRWVKVMVEVGINDGDCATPR